MANENSKTKEFVIFGYCLFLLNLIFFIKNSLKLIFYAKAIN